MTQSPTAPTPPGGERAGGGRRRRDPRIDVMRGLAMYIIFIAHVPGNAWTLYIPARFGPSDATEWFVFCSGFASAVAFGGVFARKGAVLGVMRVVYRVWQIYWAQIGMFLATAGVCVLGTWALDTRDYVQQLNLGPFFEDPQSGLIGLFTLTYVPNLFDILPMYMVALLLLPAMVGLHRLHPGLGLAAPLALWAANRALGFDLPAEWWSERSWYFNPFAWQLVFFTGFAIARGWIAVPPPNRWLVAAAAAFLIVMVPLNYHPIWSNVAIFDRISLVLLPTFEKTDFGLARYVHFLAMAYLMRCAVYGREELLYRRLVAPIRKVGQQALAVFVSSIVLSRVAGMALDLLGRDAASWALVNLSGFVLLTGIAYFVAWIKAEPWRGPGHGAPAAASSGTRESAAASRGQPHPAE